ncbi:hypothetical protein ElyMa_004337300 [Elysia marginata]|uniref:Kinesin-like protein KIF26A/B helical domain-containing protein n=1 Tax=Elysia marginata TaxID=1093978 RepID=A0AAV4H445_9GAST|nr:hypothetical protein ElyMa_004337300 [Elysia marginata]
MNRLSESNNIRKYQGELMKAIRLDNISERLVAPEPYDRWYARPGHVCAVCGTGLATLKQEAAAMVQSIQIAHTSTTAAYGVAPHYRARGRKKADFRVCRLYNRSFDNDVRIKYLELEQLLF